MNRQLLLILTMLLVTSNGSQVYAERMPEQNEASTHVVTGIVQGVFKRETATQTQYIVRLSVSAVQSPSSVKKSDVLQIYCFQQKKIKIAADATLHQRTAFQLAACGQKGHTAVPVEGQKIKVLAKHRHGRLEGIYPDWFTVIENDPKTVSHSPGSEKVRIQIKN